MEDDASTKQLTPLEKAHLALEQKRDAGEVVRRLTPVEKFLRNPSSRTAAVQANCFLCVGGAADPGWRWRIGNCALGPLTNPENLTGCPFYAMRPYRHLKGRPPPSGVLSQNPPDADLDHTETSD